MRRFAALVLGAVLCMGAGHAASPTKIVPHVAVPDCSAPWVCRVQENGAVVVQQSPTDVVIWGAPAGWHYIVDQVTHIAYLFPTADDTDTFQGGFLRNQNGSIVIAFDAGSTVGISATITGSVALTANPTQNQQFYSGVCFQLSGQSSTTCPTVGAINGCTAVNVLPCFWDVAGVFGSSLAGHTLYGVWFHGGLTMTQLNVQMACLDSAAGTFAGSNLILGDLTNGTSMGVDQYIPIGGAAGIKISQDIVCKLFAVGANTTPLSNSAAQSVGFFIR